MFLGKSLAISLVYLTGLGASFLNQVAIAYFFGSGAEVDLFFAAQSVPLFVLGISNAVISFSAPTLLVAVSAEVEVPQEEKILATGIVTTVVLAGVAGFLLFSQAPELMGYSSWSVFADSHRLSSEFRQMLAASWTSSWLLAIDYCLATFLALRSEQVFAGLVSVVPPFASIALMAMTHDVFGPVSSILGLVVGTCGLLVPLMSKSTGMLAASISPRDMLRGAFAFLKRTPAFLVASLCFTTYPLIDAYLSSFLAPGAYASLAFSQRLVIAAVGIVLAGPAILMVKQMNQDIHLGNVGRAGDSMLRVVGIVMFFITPIALASIFFAGKAVHLIFGHGRFDSAAVEQTARVFAFMAPGMLFMGAGVLLSRGMLVLKRNKLVMAQSLCWLVCYGVLAGLLSERAGARGIALAYSLTWMASTAVMLGAIKGRQGMRKSGRFLVQWLITTVLAGAALYLWQLVAERANWSALLTVGVGGFLSLSFFLASALIMRLPEQTAAFVATLKTQGRPS